MKITQENYLDAKKYLEELNESIGWGIIKKEMEDAMNILQDEIIKDVSTGEYDAAKEKTSRFKSMESLVDSPKDIINNLEREYGNDGNDGDENDPYEE